jgi:hypothetical protein
VTPTEPFTLADLDEWIADVEASRRYTLHHVPNDRARENLAALLGEPVPHRLWTPEELLATLRRAHAALAAKEAAR